MISFVIIHIGEKDFPIHIYDCIEQIRLYHEKNMIYLIINKNIKCINKLKIAELGCRIVYIEDLNRTKLHEKFIISNSHQNFYKVTQERFFILEEFMTDYQIENVLHLESDNLLYCNWNNFEDIFINDFGNIILTQDCPRRGIASVLFIKDVYSIRELNGYFQKYFVRHLDNEMFMLGKYIKRYKIKTFPVVFVGYTDKIKNINKYNYDFSKFNGVFDAAAIGQYIGGVDKRNLCDIIEGDFSKIPEKTKIVSFENPDAVYKVKNFNVKWIQENNLFRPVITINDINYNIYNLHIHSKELYLYKSNNYKEER